MKKQDKELSVKWYCCKECGKKLLKVRSDTSAKNLIVYCRGCRREWILNIH